MEVRSRAKLMFGLRHFVATPAFSRVHNLDFSSIQLDTEELRMLCQFCRKNKSLRSVNLSDKVRKHLEGLEQHLLQLCPAFRYLLNWSQNYFALLSPQF